ncbi:hypothetical protein [Blastococcus capsensis]|uniref:hypothetical protein n=1 Tax=Blastococcus capsensis TaxID=1564163 RepID=UPI00254060DF|nr:hypothetical protein [Blastococcus capsensis]MDK3257722.1 hypothetical protein [Blastococcus capsensis]
MRASWPGRRPAAGRAYLRLDCVEANPRLRRYYREQGFAEVGRREFDGAWDPVVLLQRHAVAGRAFAPATGQELRQHEEPRRSMTSGVLR